MKIWWQDIYPDAGQVKKDFGIDIGSLQKNAYSNLVTVLKQVAHKDTEIEVHFNRYSSYMVENSYLELLNNVSLIEGIIQAEKSGFDAAIIGCGNDPGLQQARQAVDIPVIGPAEAGMLLACMLGYRFSVITVAKQLVPVCERNIRMYGLEQRVAGRVCVYKLGANPMQSLMEMFINPQTIMPHFEELCLECIEDGAEVIVPACCALSPATSQIGFKQVKGVPVVDITQAAVKMAEMLVDLKRNGWYGKSRRNWYKSLNPDMRDRMAGFALGRQS